MDTKDCAKCNSTLPLTEENFYWVTRGSKRKWQSYCKPCNKQNTLDRQRAFKQRCVDYKGGKCEHCGFNKSNVALDFHHTDPTQKDFNISKLRLSSYERNKEQIEGELDKCLLLCKNCHALEHERLNK